MLVPLSFTNGSCCASWKLLESTSAMRQRKSFHLSMVCPNLRSCLLWRIIPIAPILIQRPQHLCPMAFIDLRKPNHHSNLLIQLAYHRRTGSSLTDCQGNSRIHTAILPTRARLLLRSPKLLLEDKILYLLHLPDHLPPFKPRYLLSLHNLQPSSRSNLCVLNRLVQGRPPQVSVNPRCPRSQLQMNLLLVADLSTVQNQCS
jgi:hypothetical protein